MTKLTNILLFFLLSIAFQTIAQISVLKPMGIPINYKLPLEEAGGEVVIRQINGSVWKVYSDKNINITYSSSKQEQTKYKIHYMESFYVVNEENNFLHLIADNKFDEDKNQFSLQAKDMGWISKENMLLWDHCLVVRNGEGYADKKIIFGNNSFDKNSFSINSSVTTYYDAELNEKSDKKVYFNEIYFAYKKTEKSVLVGNYKRIGENPKEVIIGWVPIEFCYFWDTKEALESNWESSAATERESLQIKSSLFSTAISAEKYSENNNSNLNALLWNNDTYENRKKANWIRFPIVEYLKDNKNIVKVQLIENEFIVAYTAVNHKLLTHPVFKKLVLVSNMELNQYLNFLSEMIDISDRANKRTELTNSLINLVDNYLGDVVEKELIPDKTINWIFENIFCYSNAKADFYKNKLSAITNPIDITEVDLEVFFNDIKIKYKEIKKIANENNTQISFISNENRYYWIETELFI